MKIRHILVSFVILFLVGCSRTNDQKVFLDNYPTQRLDLGMLNNFSTGEVVREIYWFIGGAGGGYWDAKQQRLEPMDQYARGVCNLPCGEEYQITVTTPLGKKVTVAGVTEAYIPDVFPEEMFETTCDTQKCVAYASFTPILPGKWKVELQGVSFDEMFKFKVEIPSGPRVYWWDKKNLLILTHFEKEEAIKILVWKHASDMPGVSLPLVGWKTFVADENGQLRIYLAFSPWEYPVTVENEKGEQFVPYKMPYGPSQ